MIKRVAIIFIALHLLLSCGAERLHQKAVDKGYVHTIHVDTFKVATVDTMWFEGKPYPVITYKDSIVHTLDTKYIPKWKVRFDNKRFNDSLKHIRKVYTDSLKAEIKINKQDNKAVIKTRKKGPNLFLIGFITGIFSVIIIRYAINKTLKKYS
jgi:hypothetical protein